MILLWSASPKIGSQIIRWGLNEPSSHFSMCFFEDRGDSAIVLESRLDTGVRPIWLGDFLEANEIVHALQAPFNAEEENDIFKIVSGRLRGRAYDQWAMAYWVYAGLAWKFFNKKLPHRNAWGENELLYCVEILEEIRDYLEEIGIDLGDFDLEMTSPEMAYNILLETDLLRGVNL